jgi:hypothetical protein
MDGAAVPTVVAGTRLGLVRRWRSSESPAHRRAGRRSDRYGHKGRGLSGDDEGMLGSSRPGGVFLSPHCPYGPHDGELGIDPDVRSAYFQG